MPDLNLSLAVAEYDHVRDIATGAVRAAGINLTTVHGAVEDILKLKYWKATGIYPIMHFVAIRRDVYEKNRWVAVQLQKAFEEAKNRSLVRARDITASYFPVPLMSYTVQDARSVAGDDFWPYGIEANRKTLDAFLRYADEQGVSQRRVALEEMFAPECYFASKT